MENTYEIVEHAKLLMQDAAFTPLGLTDAAIAFASADKILVITDDLDLYRLLLSRGVDALNFNHIRPL